MNDLNTFVNGFNVLLYTREFSPVLFLLPFHPEVCPFTERFDAGKKLALMLKI